MGMDELVKWARDYFCFLKSAMGKPYEIVEVKGGLELKSKDHSERIVCIEKLSVPEEGDLTIVTRNTEANRKALLNNWGAFSEKRLKIYFVEPSMPYSKWVITPFIHSKICEPSNLDKSLKSMAEAAFQSKGQ
jgi:hypothetical protein